MILEGWFGTHEKVQYSQMPIGIVSLCLAGAGVGHPQEA